MTNNLTIKEMWGDLLAKWGVIDANLKDIKSTVSEIKTSVAVHKEKLDQLERRVCFIEKIQGGLRERVAWLMAGGGVGVAIAWALVENIRS